ncbi:RNA binding motif protein 26 [Phyllostomus discolor]|uniref:RNA binding motif protein 26 n=1 Tax=Phyllostomus discolor TaxID=89673 RepID=A0A833Z1V8_9CHIR|nr:RNA binding motif protein 26 [Phyllostomus discolor]
MNKEMYYRYCFRKTLFAERDHHCLNLALTTAARSVPVWRRLLQCYHPGISCLPFIRLNRCLHMLHTISVLSLQFLRVHLSPEVYRSVCFVLPYS